MTTHNNYLYYGLSLFECPPKNIVNKLFSNMIGVTFYW